MSDPSFDQGRLDSWKEIAAYLKRDVTTVRRWERKEGLPVHRHLHEQRDSVHAFVTELELWQQNRRPQTPAPISGPAWASFHANDRRLVWRAAGVGGLCALVFFAVLHLRETSADPRVDRRTVRLSILPPDHAGDLAFSPDGRFLVFVAGGETESRLWIRPVDSVEPRPLAGTEGATTPFWSPDSRFVAFGATGKLKKVAISDGLVEPICTARAVIGGTWNRDNVIVFAPDTRSPLYRVSAAGGEAVAVTALDTSKGHNTHRWPHFFPDGRHFLYLARSRQPENSGVYVGSLESPAVTRVLSAESKVELAAGYLLFARDGALLAQPFDTSTLRSHGDPIQVLDDVRYTREDSYASFSTSPHGELAYQIGASVPHGHLAWFDGAGKELESWSRFNDIDEPSVSSDGARVAFTRSGPSKDIWLVDRARGQSRVTFEPSAELMPIWSPDGQAIAFASNRDGPSDLYQMPSNGSGPVKVLVRSNAVKYPTDWSPDGQYLVFEINDPKTGRDIWTLALEGKRSPTPFLQTEFSEGHGRLSPDGRWMAYDSDESGIREVYVRPFPSGSGKWKVSTAGGVTPRWRRNGRELFYLDLERKMMSVPVRPGADFVPGLPTVLFETRASHSGEWSYDVTPDGRRFLINVAAGQPGPAPIIVDLDWIAGLSPSSHRSPARD